MSELETEPFKTNSISCIKENKTLPNGICSQLAKYSSLISSFSNANAIILIQVQLIS